MVMRKEIMSVKQEKLHSKNECCKKNKVISSTYQYTEFLNRNTRCPASQIDGIILLSY
jgi:hypothetical protein